MNSSFKGGSCLLTVLLALVGHTGCTGTNTGNGAPSPSCAYLGPCTQPVSLTAPDGRIYRGRVSPDTTVAADPAARSEPNPPIAKLEFDGREVSYSDGTCTDDLTGSSDEFYGVQIFISKADGTIDDAGTLHEHGAARDGYFASNPYGYNSSSAPGWSVDFTLTSAGQLTATLSTTDELASSGQGGASSGQGGASSGQGGASQGGASSDQGGASSGQGGASQGGASGTAEMTTHIISINGPVAPFCGTIPAANGTFRLPCRTSTSCDISGG